LFLCAEEAPSGKIIAARGEVSAKTPTGETRPLQMESPVFLNDTIRTGKRGRAQILFLDNTIISHQGDSRKIQDPGTLRHHRYPGLHVLRQGGGRIPERAL
jgi:hypothetical protein